MTIIHDVLKTLPRLVGVALRERLRVMPAVVVTVVEGVAMRTR
jgi:hypothetical protein